MVKQSFSSIAPAVAKRAMTPELMAGSSSNFKGTSYKDA
jgi:hypothetical protein